MGFCLPVEQSKKFIESLKSGEIDPGKLAGMTSEARRAFFTKIVGEDAKDVNALFESKLLLKNQQAGMVRWAKQITGITEAARRDLITRVSKMDKILNPGDEDAFLKDLAEKKLGTEVSAEEAKQIAELSKKVSETKAEMDSGPRREGFGNATDAEMAHGRARVEFGNYVSGLKNANKPFLPHSVGEAAYELAGTSKGLKAAFDDSAIFRQGWKTLFTHSGIWMKEAPQTFIDFARQFGGKQVMDETQALIQSDPEYDLMQKAKVETGTTEEQFPSHLVEKFPVVGRLYKASEAAYTGFIHRVRAQVFKKYLNVAREAGIDVTDKKQLQSIGKLVNSLTGRGDLGVTGERAAGVVNNVFFSPRFAKSNFDFLTAHQLQKGVTPFVRKQAAINLVKVIAGSAAILTIANAIMPGSVETDPRSSDFGKIKVGSTRFDVSGGMGSLITLAVRLMTLSTKSATTHKVTPLNSGKYGASTGMDVLYNFAEGKLSPIAGVGKDILKGQDYNGNKPTVLNEANNLLTPLPIVNTVELLNTKDAADPLIGTIADALGISVNSYAPKKK